MCNNGGWPAAGSGRRGARPVILRGICRDMEAVQRWTKDYLRELVGDRPVDRAISWTEEPSTYFFTSTSR